MNWLTKNYRIQRALNRVSGMTKKEDHSIGQTELSDLLLHRDMQTHKVDMHTDAPVGIRMSAFTDTNPVFRNRMFDQQSALDYLKNEVFLNMDQSGNSEPGYYDTIRHMSYADDVQEHHFVIVHHGRQIEVKGKYVRSKPFLTAELDFYVAKNECD